MVWITRWVRGERGWYRNQRGRRLPPDQYNPRYEPEITGEWSVGHVIRQKAEGRIYRYELTGRAPYVNRQGQQTAILRWLGKCCYCGKPFACSSGQRVGPLDRSCKPCRGRQVVAA